jgi:TolB protein
MNACWGEAGPNTAPSWSADGQRIYFRRITSSGFRLFEFDIASGDEREIFSGTDPQGNATISPDGRKLYYRRLLGTGGERHDMQEAAFIERDLATGVDREVTRRNSFGAIGLSPDGRYIVSGSVDRSRTFRSMLLISIEDGSTRELLRANLQAVPDPPNPMIPLAWAPDSQSILLRREPSPGQPIEVWWASAPPGLRSMVVSHDCCSR